MSECREPLYPKDGIIGHFPRCEVGVCDQCGHFIRRDSPAMGGLNVWYHNYEGQAEKRPAPDTIDKDLEVIEEELEKWAEEGYACALKRTLRWLVSEVRRMKGVDKPPLKV